MSRRDVGAGIYAKDRADDMKFRKMERLPKEEKHRKAVRQQMKHEAQLEGLAQDLNPDTLRLQNKLKTVLETEGPQSRREKEGYVSPYVLKKREEAAKKYKQNLKKHQQDVREWNQKHKVGGTLQIADKKSSLSEPKSDEETADAPSGSRQQRDTDRRNVEKEEVGPKNLYSWRVKVSKPRPAWRAAPRRRLGPDGASVLDEGPRSRKLPPEEAEALAAARRRARAEGVPPRPRRRHPPVRYYDASDLMREDVRACDLKKEKEMWIEAEKKAKKKRYGNEDPHVDNRISKDAIVENNFPTAAFHLPGNKELPFPGHKIFRSIGTQTGHDPSPEYYHPSRPSPAAAVLVLRGSARGGSGGVGERRRRRPHPPPAALTTHGTTPFSPEEVRRLTLGFGLSRPKWAAAGVAEKGGPPPPPPPVEARAAAGAAALQPSQKHLKAPPLLCAPLEEAGRRRRNCAHSMACHSQGQDRQQGGATRPENSAINQSFAGLLNECSIFVKVISTWVTRKIKEDNQKSHESTKVNKEDLSYQASAPNHVLDGCEKRKKVVQQERAKADDTESFYLKIECRNLEEKRKYDTLEAMLSAEGTNSRNIEDGKGQQTRSQILGQMLQVLEEIEERKLQSSGSLLDQEQQRRPKEKSQEGEMRHEQEGGGRLESVQDVMEYLLIQVAVENEAPPTDMSQHGMVLGEKRDGLLERNSLQQAAEGSKDQFYIAMRVFDNAIKLGNFASVMEKLENEIYDPIFNGLADDFWDILREELVGQEDFPATFCNES